MTLEKDRPNTSMPAWLHISQLNGVASQSAPKNLEFNFAYHQQKFIFTINSSGIILTYLKKKKFGRFSCIYSVVLVDLKKMMPLSISKREERI